MENKAELIKYLKNNRERRQWLNIAREFDILPHASNKKRSDYIRRLSEKLRDDNFVSIQGLSITEIEYQDFLRWKSSSQRSTSLLEPYLNGDPNNVLVISDLHIPFEHKGAIKFFREQQEKWNCGKVIFIGDLIDNHYHSYHETDADGMSAGMELEQAILKLKEWYYTFPQADICIGNHDRLVFRRLYTAGISARWIQPIEKILGVPDWKFVEDIIYNDVLYIHGEEGSALNKAQQEFMSVVQGHRHSEGYIQFLQGNKQQLFAMQVGSMIDFNAYAFNYAKRGKKPILSCAVVLGNHPILIPYNDRY